MNSTASALRRSISPLWMWLCISLAVIPLFGSLLRLAWWLRLEQLETLAQRVLAFYFWPGAIVLYALSPGTRFELFSVPGGAFVAAFNAALLALLYLAFVRIALYVRERRAA